LTLLPRGTSFVAGFKAADDVLRQAVQGISDIIVTPGLINRDFSDIKATMLGMGFAMMGTATASGENAAVEAARQAITCPLLDEGGITGARGLLINITGSAKLGLHEVNEACTLIAEATACADVQLNFGVVLNESLGDTVKITVIATGFNHQLAPPKAVEPPVMVIQPEPEPEPAPAPPPPIAYAPEPAPSLENDVDTPAILRRGKLLF
jgi:cell division protein FtsZ